MRLKISNFFKRIFSPPVFPGEEVKTTRASLLHTITVSATIGLSLLIVGDLISGINLALTRTITILLLASLILVHHWLGSGKIFLSGIALPLIGYLMITGICLSLGTIQTPATAVYLFCVITTGAIFGKKGIAVSTLACSLAVLGIILAENAGMLAQPDYSDNYTEWILYTFLFGLIGAMTYNINQITQNALERMKTEMREREHAEMEIRKLSRAVEQSPTSIVITDLEGNIEYVNPRFTQVTGYTREEAVGQNPRILKTDLTPPGTFIQLWEQLLSGNEWRGEFVNRKKDGTEYYEAASISPILDLDGKVTHYLAVKEEMTERKRTDMNLLVRLELLEYSATHPLDQILVKALDEIGSLTQSPIGFFHFVEPDQVTLTLQAWSTRTSQEFCKAEGKNEHYNIDQAGVWVECVALRKPVIHNDYPSMPNRKGMPPGHAEVTRELVVPIMRDGLVVSILGVGNKPGDYTELDVAAVSLFADVVWEITLRKRAEEALQEANELLKGQLSENEMLQEELLEQAVRDPLTGLFNRRYLSEILSITLTSMKREDKPLCIIVMDFDHFKVINDTYGHKAGDAVLVQIARLLKNNLRASDVICRYGGEEFLLVLPGVDAVAGLTRGEQLRQMCASAEILVGDANLHVTLSFGVATFPIHGEDMDELTNKADEAMYWSKEAGRNRVTLWSSVRP